MNSREQLSSALAGRYDIEREIGAGGMATVYLARDVKHDRRVAVKVLRPELGAVLGTDRFLSEIRVTANLQHPHLLPLFDSGEANGHLFYVMPYVEGETLRDRLDRERQLPVDEAIRIATAVASALHYAHKHNVIHRDLKPENILLQEGQPVVSDFGIALAVTNAGGARITQTGLSLGTPQYMSPEQATGDRQIDARTDIYSLAVVLYEMLVGDPPHTGSTVQGVIAKVLTDKPRSVRATREAVPEHVEFAIEVALSKLPADRWATAAEFADALHGKLTTHTGAITSRTMRHAPPATRRAHVLRAIPWALVVLLLLFISWKSFGRDTPPPNVARFEMTFPPDREVALDMPGTTFALSPDGTHIVYVGASTRLYVRDLNDIKPRELPGTEGGRSPFFSPDGEWVAFLANTQLKKIALSGGTPITLVSSEPVGQGSWGDNGYIFVAATTSRWLARVPEDGGPLEPLPVKDTAIARDRRFPAVLPGSKDIIFTAWVSDPSSSQIAIASVETGETRLLGQHGVNARYANGFLIIPTAGGTVMAAPFDAKKGRLTGRAFPVLEGVMVKPGGAAVITLDTLGDLLYAEGTSAVGLSYLPFNGAPQPLLPAKEGAYLSPRFSPDGRRIAMTYRPSGAASGPVAQRLPAEIWIMDRSTRAMSRLTFDGVSNYPEWSPDGKRITFASVRDTAKSEVNGIYIQAADGSGTPELLLGGFLQQAEGLLTPDGRNLVFRDMLSGTDRNIGIVALDGPRERRWLLNSQFNESSPRMSPDGKWLAYGANDNGPMEVFVRPFPSLNGRWQVSLKGGVEPMWARDGRSLFYWVGDTLVQARLASGTAFDIADRRIAIVTQHFTNGNHAEYDVDPKGAGFVVSQPVGGANHILFVTNWMDQLKRQATRRARR